MLISLSEIYANLTAISIKELENKELTQQDMEYILSVHSKFASITNFSGNNYNNIVSDADNQMAIIADVHTDPNTMNALEVGTGKPFLIYVVVQDHNGNLRLTVGGTFSYYEFNWPISDRLTDEKWHLMLDSGGITIPSWLLESLPLL